MIKNVSPRMDAISESNINTIETFSCSSWQQIDNTDTNLTRWIPDLNAPTCHSCYTKFQWSMPHKHHCKSKFFYDRTLLSGEYS